MTTTQDLPGATPSLLQPSPQAFAAMFADGRQAAEILDVHRSTLYVLIERGTLAKHKIGAVTVFWRPDLERLREAKESWSGTR